MEHPCYSGMQLNWEQIKLLCLVVFFRTMRIESMFTGGGDGLGMWV